MIERIIHFSIKNKFIVGLFVVALIGWGTYSLTKLPIDAIPDITNNQVQVISLGAITGRAGSRKFYYSTHRSCRSQYSRYY